MWSGVGSGCLRGKKREKRIKGEEAWQLVGLVPGQLKLPVGIGGGAKARIFVGSAQTCDNCNCCIFHCCHLRSFESYAVMLVMFCPVLETFCDQRASMCVWTATNFLFPPCWLAASTQVRPIRWGCLLSISPVIGWNALRLLLCIDSNVWPFSSKGEEQGRECWPVGCVVKGTTTAAFIGCFSFKTVRLKKT